MPLLRHSTLTPAPPLRKLRVIWRVTACGMGETPWAVTPWSPATVSIRAGLTLRGVTPPAMA